MQIFVYVILGGFNIRGNISRNTDKKIKKANDTSVFKGVRKSV